MLKNFIVTIKSLANCSIIAKIFKNTKLNCFFFYNLKQKCHENIR